MTTHSFTSITFTLIPRLISESYTRLDGTLYESPLSTNLAVGSFRLFFLLCYSFACGVSMRQLYFYCSVTLAYPMLVTILATVAGAVFGFLVYVCTYTGMNYLLNSILREIRDNEREISLV